MATITFDYKEEEFRVCPSTAFRVYRKAELPMILNAVVAILTLAVGGVAALLMGLYKTPMGADLFESLFNISPNSDWYYTIVTIHGVNMLILWIVFFEVAAMYFVSTAILNSRMYSVPLAWGAFALMVLGTLFLEYSIFFDPDSTVMFTAYMPLKASPYFYLGYILFAVGVLVAGLNFFLTVYHAKKSGSYPHKGLPLTVYGVFVAVIIAVQAILNGAIVMTVALLNSLDVALVANFDADLWKQIFWGFGHTAQYINISATAAVWYALIAVTMGAAPLNEKYSRIAFLCYLVFTVPVATHHLIVDPAYSLVFKMINASILAFGLAVPSLIHAFVIPGAMEKKMRDDGKAGEGLFDWIKNLPWKEPGIGALFWSILLFGFGGIMGSIQGTYQLNMITHNTLRINAHFHWTVVAGTTIAFMGFAYYFMALIPRRKVIWGRLSSWQPHIFGLGLAILGTGMFIAGVQGAPRRTANYDSYVNLGFDPLIWDIGLWLVGLGALIAVTGGVLFVLQMVLTLFFGEKLEKEGDFATPIPAAAEPESGNGSSRLHAKSTLTIGIGFMVLFFIFYTVSFLVLAGNWPIGPGV
ncbi:MAG: cbb3-type cytochrome c oxidase subunit I [Candidatus Hodarchaeales archaeon]|jgi:cytochrome c oxidase subunit 1